MTFRPTDDDITQMLRVRGSREMPGDLRAAVTAAVQAQPRRSGRLRPRSDRPALLLAAAIALVSIAGAVSLVGSQLEPEPRQVPAPVMPSVIPATATPDAESSPSEPTTTLFGDWQPSVIGRSNTSGLGDVVTDLTVYRDGYIAVGFEYPDSTRTETKAIVWTSADGSEWRAASNDDRDLEGFSPYSVAANDSGIVLVGTYQDQTESRTYGALVSTDARSWNRVEAPSISQIAALPDRFIAASSGDKATIWTSPDGHEWTKEADLGPAWISRLRVLHIGDGLRVAAIGTLEDGFGAGRMWTASASMLDAWQRLDLEAGDYEWMRDVAASDAGLLSVAMRGYCCRVHAWTSTDGLAWQSSRAPNGDPVGIGGIEPASMASTPSGFFVSGIQHGGDEANRRDKLRAWLVLADVWLSVPTDSLRLGEHPIESILVASRPDGAVIVMTTLDNVEGKQPTPVAWVVR